MVEELIKFGESFTPLPDYRTEPRRNKLQLRRFMIKAYLLEAFYEQIKPSRDTNVKSDELRAYYELLELMNRITSTKWDQKQTYIRYHRVTGYIKCYTVPQLIKLIKEDYCK